MWPDEENQRLLRAVRAGLLEAPDPSASAPPEEGAPRAWEAWLLVCLLRHRSRQRWLVEMVEERLQREGIASEGPLPGYAGWRYAFYDGGCCFVGPGETLDVGFHGDEGASINPYLFTQWVVTLAAPGLPETRLVALLPGFSLIYTALGGLRARGLFESPFESPHDTQVFRLAPEWEALVEPAVRLDAEEAEVLKRCLAHLGDFEALQLLASGEDPRARGESARRLRRDWLLPLVRLPETSEDALHALERLLPADEQVRVCEQVLGDAPLSAATSHAVEHLDAMPGSAGHEAVLGVLARVSPLEDHAHLMQAASRYLLRRGIEREHVSRAMLAFARVNPVPGSRGHPFLEQFALLALEWAHEDARELVRLALRSSGVRCRAFMAAVLCLLDRPWCQRELVRVLQECGQEESAGVFALALDPSGSDWARAAAHRWRRESARDADSGRTWAEMEEERCAGVFDWARQEVGPWVERTRARLPEDDCF